MQNFDAIVLGVGGMGSAAMYSLASRGVNVLGIEQFGIAHDRGSSHGQTRIIRKAYFEHPDYVPLLDRAYSAWSDIESAIGRSLISRTGLLLAGPSSGMVVPGVRLAAEKHGLAIEDVSLSECASRFPGFAMTPELEVLFESDAGFLWVEDCVRSLVTLATNAGAMLHTGERVQNWSADSKGIDVHTDRATYRSEQLIICAGAWTSGILESVNWPLEVRRKVVLWCNSANPAHHIDAGCPVFGFETMGRFFYGFPSLDGEAIKVGDHTSGKAVTRPDDVDRSLREQDTQRIAKFLKKHVPEAAPQPIRHSICFYTMTPDEHFIVDRHPEHENVFIAAGFSGHGFKFAPVVGSVLADLAMEGCADAPIAFLSANRPSLRCDDSP